ncbi:hypothetical protein ACFL0W_02020 [Nanoarchaeota archaeon]
MAEDLDSIASGGSDGSGQISSAEEVNVGLPDSSCEDGTLNTGSYDSVMESSFSDASIGSVFNSGDRKFNLFVAGVDVCKVVGLLYLIAKFRDAEYVDVQSKLVIMGGYIHSMADAWARIAFNEPAACSAYKGVKNWIGSLVDSVCGDYIPRGCGANRSLSEIHPIYGHSVDRVEGKPGYYQRTHDEHS